MPRKGAGFESRHPLFCFRRLMRSPRLIYRTTEVVEGEVAYQMAAKVTFDDVIVIQQEWTEDGKLGIISLLPEELEAILKRYKRQKKGK